MKLALPLDGLRAALASQWPTLAEVPLEPLTDKGLAHWHVRLCGSGWLARVPKQSQIGLAAQANLDYQAACFERAGALGFAPRLLGCLSPAAGLPRGALLVEEVSGRPAKLPVDLPALAVSLAALHGGALPPEPARAPLWDPADPLAALATEIDRQAQSLDAAALTPAARRRIDAELARWNTLSRVEARPPRTLIAFDAHPGNFIVRPDGRAMLVDLEKARYGPPALDLAHATLYTSTTWDLEARADLSLDDVAGTYERWCAAMPDSAPHRPWFVPLRRAMWLWSISWCAMWRAQSRLAPNAGGDGADWSVARSDSALVAHVRERVDHYLSPEGIERVCDEADALAGRWPT